MIGELAPLDEVLAAHRTALGADFVAYRNHAYRVVNLCVLLASDAAGSLEKVALAAAFHDLGIWTARTFDYLSPSSDLALAHLARARKAEWSPEMSAMIQEHHKLTPYRRSDAWLVEPFRRADLIDVSRGWFSFGLARRQLRAVFAEWPNAGFHGVLGRHALAWLRSHPFRPLPMMKW